MIQDPCFHSGCTNAQYNNQIYDCCQQKAYKYGCINNQIGWDWFCMGDRTSSTQQVKYVGNTDVFYFGFYFMTPKWTRTKIVIEITLLLQAYSCLPLVQAAYWLLRIGPEILIEISLVLIAHGNENPFHHVLVRIFMI